METVIVYIDDAAHARQTLSPRLASQPAAHWVLVACAPRATHRISKWVSHSTRENWRAKWSAKLFGEVVPWLRQHGAHTSEVLARGPLDEVQARLAVEHHGAAVLDARRPKQDYPSLPGAVAGFLGLALVFGE